MATIKQNARRVVVLITAAELNALLIQPAKQAGFINFDPTRVKVDAVRGEGFEITFERVEAAER